LEGDQAGGHTVFLSGAHDGGTNSAQAYRDKKAEEQQVAAELCDAAAHGEGVSLGGAGGAGVARVGGGSLAVRPEAGLGLLWYNDDTQGRLDERARHAGCRVLRGEKWVLNLWVWLRPNALRMLEGKGG
jgi:hypothetical protein